MVGPKCAVAGPTRSFALDDLPGLLETACDGARLGLRRLGGVPGRMARPDGVPSTIQGILIDDNKVLYAVVGFDLEGYATGDVGPSVPRRAR